MILDMACINASLYRMVRQCPIVKASLDNRALPDHSIKRNALMRAISSGNILSLVAHRSSNARPDQGLRHRRKVLRGRQSAHSEMLDRGNCFLDFQKDGCYQIQRELALLNGRASMLVK